MNESKETIYKKLFAVQKSMGAISKDATNPYFQSKYFDINGLLKQLKPILIEHGLVILQPLATVGDKTVLKTIIVDTETNESISDEAILPMNDDPQKMGSIITYFRRYALQSLLLIEAEDDDGNAGQRTPEHAPTQAEVSKKEPDGTYGVNYKVSRVNEDGKIVPVQPVLATRNCRFCGNEFTPRASYEYACKSCYIKNKNS